MELGDPVGSRTLSKHMGLSPATIRNVMADLEDLGLLQAPHVSAGRLPTDLGLRYFVDGILEIGTLSAAEQAAMEAECAGAAGMEDMLEQASRLLSGLSSSAGLVVAPKADKAVRHIEFVALEPGRALVILVSGEGIVENRIMELPPGVTADALKKAGAFLSERLHGRTISEMRTAILEEITARQSELGVLTAKIIESGLVLRAGDGTLIVRGQANLLDARAAQDLERIRLLMEQLEAKETVSRLLAEAGQAGGVKIYIGSENPVFQGNGHALILTPYKGGSDTVIGAVGVIGPARLDYARIIPGINCMAEIISRKIRSFSDR